MAILATRVVPEISGNPTYKEVSLRWIDAFGDLRSDVIKIDSKATELQIEEMVTRSVSASNASLYTVRVTDVYAGEKSKDNASGASVRSVQAAIIMHYKNVQRESRRAYIPAPRRIDFIDGTEVPDPNDDRVRTLLDAWDVLLTASYNRVSLRFTQRRDMGKKKDL